MSHEISLNLTKADGSVVQQRVPMRDSHVHLSERQLVAVSDNIALLTRVTKLRLWGNALAEIPSGVLTMTRLTELSLHANRLAAIPREIGRLRALTHLSLSYNRLVELPSEIGHLHALKWLGADNNALTSLPAELGQLSSLDKLYLNQNVLALLPMELNRLPATTQVYLNGNPLPIKVGPADWDDSRSKLPALFAATTWPTIASIRQSAIDLLVGLQDLELPALVTLEIIDAAFPNSIPMHKKWELATAVKHFHQRRGIER